MKAPFAAAGPRAAAAAGLLAGLLVLPVGLPSSLAATATHGEAVGADGPAYVRIARGLLRGTLELPPPDEIDSDRQQRLHDPFGTPYARGRDGRLLPKHSVAYGALLVPGVAVGGHAGGVVVAVLLGAVLVGFVTARTARMLGALPALAASVALFLLSPGGRWIVTGVNLDTVLAGAMVAAFALAAGGRPAAAGVLAGLCPLLRPTAVVLLLPAAAALPTHGARHVLRFAAGVAAGGLGTALVQTWLWGAPWRTAYERAVVFVDGAARLSLHSTEFGADPAAGLRALFLDEGGGFARLAPAALLALAGFLLPGARRPEWVGATAAALASLLLLAPYSFLQEVPAGNYRFAFPLLVSAVPPLAALLSEAGRWLGAGPNASETRSARAGSVATTRPPAEPPGQPRS